MHNIASCLHCLDDFATAKEYYERALAAFEGPSGDSGSRFSFSYLVYGNVNRKRCEFVRERLVDIEFNRRPDLEKYLDGYGQKRTVTPDMAEKPPPRPTYASTYGYAASGFGEPMQISAIRAS
jgi:hypothetical protein